MDDKKLEKLQSISDWDLDKPKKDKDWAKDIKKESLDIKKSEELDSMLTSHSEKLTKVEKDLDKFTNWPEAVKYELHQRFTKMFEDNKVDEIVPETIEGKTMQEWIDEEFESQQLYYTWKVAKLNQSIDRITKAKELKKG